MTATDRTDIRAPLNEICDRLGIEPRQVRTLTIKPRTVTAAVFRLNENGSKFIENDEPASDTLTFDVQT